MTTTWKITPDWQGQTVAVLASGPNMSQEVADALREHRRIVVNFTHRLAPDADMLVALDGNWPQELRDFAGLRVTGVLDDDLDALYIGPRWERVQMAPGHEIEVHNSGLTAIRIAASRARSCEWGPPAWKAMMNDWPLVCMTALAISWERLCSRSMISTQTAARTRAPASRHPVIAVSAAGMAASRSSRG